MPNTQQIVAGFPRELRAEAEAVAGRLPEPRHVLTPRTQRVLVQGEDVELPARIYNPELHRDAMQVLTSVQRLVTACIYSRHHDGYVRQASCAALLPAREPWVVPYVVQLLGEYVVEISNMILDGLTAQSAFGWSSYQDFAGANQAFIALTEQRAISYWSCYYRQAFSRSDYPALRALSKLRETAAG